MKRWILVLTILALVLGFATATLAQAPSARIRVVHASPDAPAVDVLVNDAVAFSNAPFKGITDYASIPPATYNIKVVPTGTTAPVVIDTDLTLTAEPSGYTVVAVGKLAAIEPLVLVDNNATPAAGFAHVRFVHASPDAPAVDIAVKGGPVLFSNVRFKEGDEYISVAATTYDLEVRLEGTDTVVLDVPGVKLADRSVYTIFAMGLAAGTPSLMAVPSVDAAFGPAPLLPAAGGTDPYRMAAITLVALATVLIIGGMALRLYPTRR
jgi:hypothetical protein